MSNLPSPTPDEFVEIYRRMARIKLHDERVIQVMKSGELQMPYYSVRGQEIIPAAISMHLRSDDYLTTIYRGTHDMISKGFPLDLMWAELAGRITGSCKGKGGPMHLTHPETGVMLTTGVVGSSMPIANGLAWASLLDETDQVTVANFGDGAANIGAFHEALNMAGLWKLPVVFVCQNNRYAEATRFDRSTAVDKISSRAAGYGFEGITVDGNDAAEMFGVSKIAIDRARAGDGPTLIEANTFRFNGHYLGDGGAYIDKDEYARAQEADPYIKLRKHLIESNYASEDQLDEIHATINAELDDAVKSALAAEFPTIDEMKRDVFAHELS